MSNYSIKIDLQKLNKAALLTIPGKTGRKRCICIPVDENPEIFVGEKGTYLNLTAMEMKEEGKYGDTHFLKANFPEDIYSAMSEEERRSWPILGQMRPLVKREQPAPEVTIEEQDDDLPF